MATLHQAGGIICLTNLSERWRRRHKRKESEKSYLLYKTVCFIAITEIIHVFLPSLFPLCVSIPYPALTTPFIHHMIYTSQSTIYLYLLVYPCPRGTAVLQSLKPFGTLILCPQSNFILYLAELYVQLGMLEEWLTQILLSWSLFFDFGPLPCVSDIVE